MRSALRISLMVMVAGATMVFTAVPAAAALLLVFDPGHQARADAPALSQPGQELRVRTGGNGGMGSIKRAPIFYAPQAISLPKTVESQAELRAAGAVRFRAPLVADSRGTGHATLVAPEAPGRYQLVVYCPECETASQGSNVLWVGGIHVSGATLPNTGDSIELTIPMIMIALGSIALLLVDGFRRRGARGSAGSREPA